MRRLALLILTLFPIALAAQTPDEDEEPLAPWRLSYFPYITGGVNDAPVVAARIRYWQPAGYEDRVTANASLDAGAGIAPKGSRYLGVQFRAPQLVRDWRFTAAGLASRDARLGYYGLGNTVQKNDDLATDAQPFLYRVGRTVYRGQAEATRRLKGPLQVGLMLGVESARFSSLPGPSVFDSTFGSRLSQTDASARVALIYDSRDNEFNTHQGLLLETGAQVGSGGGDYTRLYSVLRGYLTVREGTVLAARLAASGMGGSPPLAARFVIPSWEYPIQVLGGQYSHRAIDTGRLAGRHVLLGNFEVRHDLLPFGDLGAVSLIGFLDAGRVFEGESFRLTTDDLAVGGGGGIALRILRSTIFTFNFAGGPDGFNFSVGNGWMF